jgi:hypothetical protein
VRLAANPHLNTDNLRKHQASEGTLEEFDIGRRLRIEIPWVHGEIHVPSTLRTHAVSSILSSAHNQAALTSKSDPIVQPNSVRVKNIAQVKISLYSFLAKPE